MESEVAAEPPTAPSIHEQDEDMEPPHRLLSFREYRGTRHPTRDLGEVGDIYISMCPSNYALYAKLDDDWAQWPGPGSMLTIVHPDYEEFTLGVNMKKKIIGWLESGSLEDEYPPYVQFPHDALFYVLEGNGVRYVPRIITGDKRRSSRAPEGPPFKRPKLGPAGWTRPDQEEAPSRPEDSDSDDDFYWTDQEDEEKLKKVPERPIYPPEDLVALPRRPYTGTTVTSAITSGKDVPTYADDTTIVPPPPTPPPSPPPPQSPRLAPTSAKGRKNATKAPRSRAPRKTPAAKKNAKKATKESVSAPAVTKRQSPEPGPSKQPSVHRDDDGESERSDTPDPATFDYDSDGGSDDSGERQGFFTRADVTFQPEDSRFPTPTTPAGPEETHRVVLIHPPFTRYPGSGSGHALPLTYSLLVEHPDWVLDARDFVWNGNPNPRAVPYPASLEPPRGRLIKESRLRCTFCNRSYAGVNAKSMWRRHVFDFHGIAMTNRRDGVGKSTLNPPMNGPRDPSAGLKIQSAPGSSLIIPPPSRTQRLPPRSLAENVPAHLPGSFSRRSSERTASRASSYATPPPPPPQLQPEPQPEPQPERRRDVQPEPQPEPQPQAQTQAQPPIQPSPQPQPQAQPPLQPQPQPQTQVQPQVQPQVQYQPQPYVQPQPQPYVQPQPQPVLHPQPQPLSQPYIRYPLSTQTQLASYGANAGASGQGTTATSATPTTTVGGYYRNPNRRHHREPDPPFPRGPSPPRAFEPLVVTEELKQRLLAKLPIGVKGSITSLTGDSRPPPGQTSTSTLATYDSNGEARLMAAAAMKLAEAPTAPPPQPPPKYATSYFYSATTPSYPPSASTSSYGASQPLRSYASFQAVGSYASSQSGGSYASSHPVSTYAPAQPVGSYTSSQPGRTYAPSQPGPPRTPLPPPPSRTPSQPAQSQTPQPAPSQTPQPAPQPAPNQSAPATTPSPASYFPPGSLPRNFPPPPSSAPPSYSNLSSFTNGSTSSSSFTNGSSSLSNGMTSGISSYGSNLSNGNGNDATSTSSTTFNNGFGHGINRTGGLNGNSNGVLSTHTGLPMDTSFLPPNFQQRFPSAPSRSTTETPDERKTAEEPPSTQREPVDPDACQCFIPTQSCVICRMRRQSTSNGANKT